VSETDRRRFLLTALAGVVTAPLRAAAQQAKTYRIGYLGGTSSATVMRPMASFREGLRTLGWTEGRDLVIEERWADGRAERLPELAAELVALKTDVIVTQGSPATRAAKIVTATIPIVMVNTTDPIGQGFIASLNRPGGNITGSADFAGELSVKRLELLKETLPALSRVAILFDPVHPAHAVELRATEQAAKVLGIRLVRAEATSSEDFSRAFDKILRVQAEAPVVLEGFANSQHRLQIVEFAATNRLPVMSGALGFTGAGGLISYTPDVLDMYRRAAGYVDRILRGAKPSDMPVEQPTKLLLVLNLKTARALGVTIPPSVLTRADQLIE
jgi:putative ABC transport system substrate-binding protein